MKKVLAIGEILLRLTPPSNLKISQASNFDFCFGGAEANVAVGLSNLGIDTIMLTSLPDNDLGKAAKIFLKSNDVCCKHIISKGDRLGIYYYEEGISARKAKVTYDRKYSSINDLRYEDIDIDELLDEVEVIHISGISFALNKSLTETLTKIIDEAKKRNIKISVDLNYRSSLWKSYDEFAKTLKPIVKDSYICFGWLNKDTSNFKVFDAATDTTKDDNLINQFKYMTEELNVKNVVTTLRSGNAFNYHTLSGVLFDGEKIYKASKYEFSMVSRIGGGDAFAAGVIHGFIKNKNPKDIIEFATATAVLKQTQIGDISISTENEVLDLIENKNLGSVNR
ncbi:MAG: sugar kinase [Peptostreptococcaceae bacterium]